MKLWMLDAIEEAGEGEVASAPSAPSALAAAPSAPSPSLPFLEARALVSIACADGPPKKKERELVHRLLVGVVVERDDWRVWRPSECGPPPSLLEAQRVLGRMKEIALVDENLDDSERTLLLEFARAWGVDPDVVDPARSIFLRWLREVW